jgi:hypothetical protein
MAAAQIPTLGANQAHPGDLSTQPTRDPAPFNGMLSIGIFIGMFVLGALINSFASKGGIYPAPGDSAQHVVEWRTANADTVRITGVVAAFAGLAIMWHGAWLATVVRQRTNNREASLLTFAGGLVAGGFMLFGAMLQWILESPETLADVPLMRAFDRLLFAVAGPGSVVGFLFLAGASALALRGTTLLPAWLSVLGVIAGGLSLLSLLLLVPQGGEGFALVSTGRFPALLWLIAVSILIGRRLRSTASTG